MFYWILAVCALLIRLFFAPYTSFGIDESYMIDRFSWGSEFPLSNGSEVYKWSLRPGLLISLVLGIPLKFVQAKSLWGVWIMAILGWLTALLTFKIYSDLLKNELTKRIVFVAILFAPWPIIFNSLWHASFTPLSGVLFFLSLKALTNPDSVSNSNGRFNLGSSGIFASFILCFQIGLYFLPLALVYSLLVWTKRISPPMLKDFLIPLLLAAATLGPFYLWGPNLSLIPENHPRYLETQTTPHPHSIFERNPELVKNNKNFSALVSVHPENFLQLPKVIYRFLSFATFETSRFLGPGFKSTWKTLVNNSWLIPFILVSWLPSLVLGIATALYFYFSKKRFYFVFQTLFLRPNENVRKLTFEEVLEICSFSLPFIFTAAFLFSFKGPSAHTFWLIWPLAFFPFIKIWSSKLEKLRQLMGPLRLGVSLGFLFFSALLGSLYGHAVNPRTCTLQGVRSAAAKNDLSLACPMGDPEARLRAFDVIRRELFDANENRTSLNSK